MAYPYPNQHERPCSLALGTGTPSRREVLQLGSSLLLLGGLQPLQAAQPALAAGQPVAPTPEVAAALNRALSKVVTKAKVSECTAQAERPPPSLRRQLCMHADVCRSGTLACAGRRRSAMAHVHCMP